MTNSTQAENPTNQLAEAPQTPISAWRCISGSLVAGAIATACYMLTSAIAQTYARKPIHTDNVTAINIASAVRTLVVGISALGTFIFALASLGLMALAIKILIGQLMKRSQPPSNAK